MKIHQKSQETAATKTATDVASVKDCSGQNWDEAVVSALKLLTFHAAVREGTMRTPPRAGAGWAFTMASPAAKGSDLSHADLHGADLSHADLHGANLSRTNLFQARLDHANLEHADLRGADLRSARLTAAHLAGAKLYGAIFNEQTLLPFGKEAALHKGMIHLEANDG